jgi:hypothetical protein
VRLPKVVSVNVHWPAPLLSVPIQELTPSLTVTLPLGVPLPGGTAATVNITVTTCVQSDGSGLSEVMVAVVSALMTVNCAVLLAAPTVGVCVVVTPEVVLLCVPMTLLLTAKVTVQEPLLGMVMPLKLKAVAPAANVLGVVPVHVPVTAPPTALILVNVSVNEPLVKAVLLLLLSVSVTVELAPL